jgi:hypothetical protein
MPRASLRDLTRFALFFVLFLAIVGVIVGSRNLLIAPPFAVTAYLVVFNRSSRYSRASSIAASYLVVIASSELLEYTLGTTVEALVVNVALVAAFITLTPLSHPPAIALTIFAYIVHDTTSVVLASVVVVIVVAVADVVFGRVKIVRDLLADPPQEPESGHSAPAP